MSHAGSVGKGLVHGSKTEINLALFMVVTVAPISISYSTALTPVFPVIGDAGEVGQFSAKSIGVRRDKPTKLRFILRRIRIGKK